MTKLSEKEVLSRSRAACLSNVRKLISWGNDLTDISIVRKTVNLEILNVSVNKLTSLRDLSHCPKLKELYLRKNCIRNLEEVAYLKNLPQLTVLWINDNPMCDEPHSCLHFCTLSFSWLLLHSCLGLFTYCISSSW